LLSILISVPELVVAPSTEATTTASTRTRAAARARKVGALGTRLIDRQLAILQYLAVQPSDGLLEVCAFGKLNESESLGIACHPVPDDLCRCDLETRVGHQVGQFVIGNTARFPTNNFEAMVPPICRLPSEFAWFDVQPVGH